MSKLRKALVFGLAVLLVVAVAACAAPPEEPTEAGLQEYVLPTFVDASGVYANVYNTAATPAALSAIDFWNDETGLEIGVKIVPKVYDTRYNWEEAGSLYDRSIAADNPIAINSLVSPASMANLDKFAENKTPAIQWFGYGAMHRPGAWLFMPGGAYAQMDAVAINWWATEVWQEARKPRVAVAVFEGVYGEDLMSILEPYFAQNPNIDYQGVFWHPPAPVDLTGYARDMMKAEPDFIFHSLTGVSMPAYYSALKELGYLGKVVNMHPCYMGLDTVSRTLDSALIEGDYAVATTSTAPGTKFHKAYMEYATRHYGNAIWGATATQYASGTCLILSAIERAVGKAGPANLTGELIYNEIEGGEYTSEELWGATGNVKMDPKNRLSGATVVYIYQQVNGIETLVGEAPMDMNPVLMPWVE